MTTTEKSVATCPKCGRTERQAKGVFVRETPGDRTSPLVCSFCQCTETCGARTITRSMFPRRRMRWT